MLWKKLMPLLAVILAGLAGCDSRPGGTPASGNTKRESYEVKGTLKELKPDGKTAVIAHDKIPGYMEAMTMDFEVHDKRELSGLKPNDRLAFRLVVTTNDAWIENIRKIAPEATNLVQAAVPSNAPPPSLRQSPVVEPLEIGDLVPDYKFTNQLNEPVSLSQFRGRAVGLTFLFTRCPLPTYCPRMSGNFAVAARQLAEPGGPTNWMLLSISFDPEWDTPARLALYARQYNPDPAHWNFVTSDFWNLDGLTEQLGLQFWKASGSISHNLRTAVLDTRGRLQTNIIGNEWKVEDFVAEMKKAAQVK